MSMCLVTLIRPGRTEFDKQQRIQGGLNISLSDDGLLDIRQISDRLRDDGIECLLSSTLDPALSTAQALSEQLEIPHKSCEGFDNVGQGLWEGLELEEVKRKYCKAFKKWENSPGVYCPPQGEEEDEILARLRKNLLKHLKKYKHVGIVTAEPLASFIKQVLTGKTHPVVAFCQNSDPVSLLETIKLEDEGMDKVGDTAPLKISSESPLFFFL